MDIRSEFIRDLATMSEEGLLEQARTIGELKQAEADPLWHELYQRQINVVAAIAILRFPKLAWPEVLEKKEV